MTRYARDSLVHLILVHWQVRCSASKLGLLNKELRFVKERFQQIFYHLWILTVVISERVWQATVTANPVPGMLTTVYSMPKQFFIMSTGTLDVWLLKDEAPYRMALWRLVDCAVRRTSDCRPSLVISRNHESPLSVRCLVLTDTTCIRRTFLLRSTEANFMSCVPTTIVSIDYTQMVQRSVTR